MPIVQIEMFEGRTIEQKREMVKEVTRSLVRTVNCQPEAEKIVIREIKKENLAEDGMLYCDRES